MSKSLDDILRNKGDLKPRQVEKIFNANGVVHSQDKQS